MSEAKEPTATVIAPAEHKDVFDLATGLRFHEGRATGVPLSQAIEAFRGRKGYHVIPDVHYQPIKRKARKGSDYA